MNVTMSDAAIERIVNRLAMEKGEGSRERALEGTLCAAAYWRDEDGSAADFEAFCVEHFAATDEERSALFSRLESAFEELNGSALAVSRAFQWGVHVDSGPLLAVDAILSGWSPQAHLSDDFFGNKLAFVVHLNFPYKGIGRKLKEGPGWTRRQWAEARLGDCFTERAPAEASSRLASAFAEAEAYVAGYYLYPSRLRDGDSGRLFPDDKRLLMHWNVRDEIKALYADPEGLPRQRLLYKAMERVVEGRIPRAFVDSRGMLWDPFSGVATGEDGSPMEPEREADGRYERLLAIFRAEREYDLWCPDNPTLVARKFAVEREIPERDVERLFHDVLSSACLGRAAGALRERLGRPLEAFDVWYKGFGDAPARDEAALDEAVRRRYPDARAFEADLPRILGTLGFGEDEARWLSARIAVDRSRGSGHAMPAAKRSDSVRLRTRVPDSGMDYKGFNIACHELGHNVEQVFSLHGIDEYFLAGVPNNAFTEAFAFVFQARDLAILGVDGAPRGPSALSDYWTTCEIAGVGLVDMELWRWMYAHPECDARDLREAAMAVSRSVWNRYFAEAFGLRDALALGSYAHMVEHAMYLPDYPLGHLIAFQIEAAMAGRTVGESMGRMCRLGRLSPDQWMREATGSGLSAGPLLSAAEAALSVAGA
ncbi:MAG: hypothetical protein KKA67_16715 [Spirochaetes bacterium]|nr:hypothetical protein [Spirochaetota bacterium]MBU1080263.1 hypothetical protein [Spirochaetota bacterium]